MVVHSLKASTSLLIPYEPKTIAEKRLFQILLILSFFVILAIIIYYFLNPSPTHIVGYQLVNTAGGAPLEVPSPSIFPFYAKPVTYLLAAGVVFCYCLFSLGQGVISTRFPRWLRAFLLLASVLFLIIGLYELLFSFTFWGSAMVNHLDPDTVSNPWPVGSLVTNLTFDTKMILLWVVVAFVSTMTFRKSLESD